jgi:hypothetical protein
MPPIYSSFFGILGGLRNGNCNFFLGGGKEVILDLPVFAQEGGIKKGGLFRVRLCIN